MSRKMTPEEMLDSSRSYITGDASYAVPANFFGSSEMSFAPIANGESNAKAIATKVTGKLLGNNEFIGTGVAFENNRVLTAKHVVQGTMLDELVFVLSKNVYKVAAIVEDGYLDLCVLMLEKNIAEVSFPIALNLNEQHFGAIFMYYFCEDDTNKLQETSGDISSSKYYQIQATALLSGGKGASGSGYWNGNGDLIGIHVCAVNSNERQCVFLANTPLVNSACSFCLVPEESALCGGSQDAEYETVTKYVNEVEDMISFLQLVKTAKGPVDMKQVPDIFRVDNKLLEEHQKAHTGKKAGKSKFNSNVISVLQPFAVCLIKIGTAHRLITNAVIKERIEKKADNDKKVANDSKELKKIDIPTKCDSWVIDVKFDVGTNRNGKQTSLVFLSGDTFTAKLFHIYPCGEDEKRGANKTVVDWSELSNKLKKIKK